MPQILGRYGWDIGERKVAAIGLGAGMFGFGGPAHWIGGLAGPRVGLSGQPLRVPLTIGGELALDFGRLTTLTAWGYPMRYWGFYPAVELHAHYGIRDHVATGASVAARYVSTLGWSGCSIEPGLFMRFGL